MNVIFHTLTSIATAAILSSFWEKDHLQTIWNINKLKFLGIGFITGIIVHGILDYLPHNYPLPALLDVIVALLLFIIVVILSQTNNRLLLISCFLGAIFPDLLDLGPAIINKQLEIHLPVVKLFPWHWQSYSGSIYNGTHKLESLFCHMLVLGLCVYLLFQYGHNLYAPKPKTLQNDPTIE